MRVVLTFGWLVVAQFLLVSESAQAKPEHFQQVRAVLMSRVARCTTCHTSDDGSELNAYGQAIAQQPGDGIGMKLMRFEEKARQQRSDAAGNDESGDAARKTALADIDGDGVPNWIEVLGNANPADANDRPALEWQQRIEGAVGCNICHSAVGIPGQRGLAANPHHAYGKLLSHTFVTEKGRPRPKGREAQLEAAGRTPILQRMNKARGRKPRGSAATYWQKLRLMHDLNKADDEPTKEDVQEFKQRARRQRSAKQRDPHLGWNCDAHPIDAFLKDARRLE